MARATRFQAAYPKEPPMTLWQTIASAFLLLAVYIIIAIRRELGKPQIDLVGGVSDASNRVLQIPDTVFKVLPIGRQPVE